MAEKRADTDLGACPRGRIATAWLILLSLFATVWAVSGNSPGARAQAARQMDLPVGGVVLNAEYAGFTRGEVIDNEKTHPGLGVTIAYHGGERGEATIYVYNLGEKAIPDGPMSDVVRAEFDKTTREVFEVQQTTFGARVELVGQYGTLSPDRGEAFLCSEFIITDDRGSHRSFLYLTGASENFVKIRITLRTSDETDATARNFADAVARGLWARADEQPDANKLQ